MIQVSEPTLFNTSPTDAWDVLKLFIIPIGGGIPAGVVLAKSRNIAWPMMVILYFISDVMLAFVFEPILLLFISFAKKSPALTRVKEHFKKSLQQMNPHYGTPLGPLALILFSFGSDPMTGRTVAVAAGHGFVKGWTFAIIGDLFYFSLLMVSTLWLNDVLGDGTWATMIILVLMVAVPILIRKLRGR